MVIPRYEAIRRRALDQVDRRARAGRLGLRERERILDLGRGGEHGFGEPAARLAAGARIRRGIAGGRNGTLKVSAMFAFGS